MGYGVTRIKDPVDGQWKVLAGCWHKTNGGWVPVHKIYNKTPTGDWKIVYPVPRGILTLSESTWNVNIMVNETVTHTFTISNTGDDTLIVTNPPTINAGTTFGINGANPTSTGWAVTLAPGQSTEVVVSITGTLVGVSTGTVIFNYAIGILGVATTPFTINATVRPAYSLISVTPSSTEFTYHYGSLPTDSTRVTITNYGTGLPLNISSIASQTGRSIVYNPPLSIPAGTSASFVVISATNLPPGANPDTIIITNDSHNNPSYEFSVNTNIVGAPSGSQDFTPGSYVWQVPQYVYSITITGAGGGGGGGSGAGDVSGIGNGATNGSIGGGGSAGDVISPVTRAVTPGEILIIVVGAGGRGQLGYGGWGESGGTTEIQRAGGIALASAGGGAGGPSGLEVSRYGACGNNGCSNSVAQGGSGGVITSEITTSLIGGMTGTQYAEYMAYLEFNHLNYGGGDCFGLPVYGTPVTTTYSMGNGQGGGGGAGWYNGQNGGIRDATGGYLGSGGKGGDGFMRITW